MTLRFPTGRALRTLRRAPGFAASVVATLAAGVALSGPVLALVRARNASPAAVDAAPQLDRAPGGGWTAELRTVPQLQAETVDALFSVAAALAVLLAAGTAINLLMLLLSRATTRRQEVAVRAVVGATPMRIARQTLAEGAVLALAGTAAGLAVGLPAHALLSARWPGAAAWAAGHPVPVLLAVAAGLAAVLLLGALAPAAGAARRSLHGALTTGLRATAGPTEGLLRRALVVLQFGASATLLAGAVLLVRASSPGGDTARLGFDPRDTLTFRVDLGRLEERRRAAVQEEMLERLRHIEGVRAAAAATPHAWLGLGDRDVVQMLCGDCYRANVRMPIVAANGLHVSASPGYFAALGIRLREGREPRAGAREVVLSRALAGHMATRQPIGQKVLLQGWLAEPYTVVGVADEVRARGLGQEVAPVGMLYVPSALHPPRTPGFAVRTTGDPGRTVAAVRQAVAAALPGARALEVMTMAELLRRNRAPLRWFGLLLAVVAAGATAVCAGGLYSVMSYGVARRTREIGTRMALGAAPRDVLRQVLGEGFRISLYGAGAGLVGALTLARELQRQFYGVDSLDPVMYTAVALVLAAVTLIAGYVPARRATRVDPVVALRTE
ncbi:MAG TPA: FtsX-like permease family protein [Longimicrobium sp.]|nr:FtsX-like permease family protein [Longimicrobium sp.]